MKKTEEYIKPIVFDQMTVDAAAVEALREELQQLKKSGELERTLSRKSKVQKRAQTKNGPHPHLAPLEQAASLHSRHRVNYTQQK